MTQTTNIPPFIIFMIIVDGIEKEKIIHINKQVNYPELAASNPQEKKQANAKKGRQQLLISVSLDQRQAVPIPHPKKTQQLRVFLLPARHPLTSQIQPPLTCIRRRPSSLSVRLDVEDEKQHDDECTHVAARSWPPPSSSLAELWSVRLDLVPAPCRASAQRHPDPAVARLQRPRRAPPESSRFATWLARSSGSSIRGCRRRLRRLADEEAGRRPAEGTVPRRARRVDHWRSRSADAPRRLRTSRANCRERRTQPRRLRIPRRSPVAVAAAHPCVPLFILTIPSPSTRGCPLPTPHSLSWRRRLPSRLADAAETLIRHRALPRTPPPPWLRGRPAAAHLRRHF
ncbi:unnamed protein product [Urochloa humidicola]